MKKFSDFRKINEQEVTLNKDNQEDKNAGSPFRTNTSQSIESGESTEVKNEPAKFFSKLLESREMAQVYHWTVKGEQGSHSSHTALNDYYDSVIDLIDTLVEVYQGQYDIIEEYDVIDTKETKSKDKIEYFKDIANFIKENRYESISREDTHLQNIIDEIVSTIYRLIYKLRFNK
jgi:DNA-binding ferritin-like protein